MSASLTSLTFDSTSSCFSTSSTKKPSYIIVYDKSGINELCRTATYQQIQNLVDDRLYRVEYYSQAPHAIQDTLSNPVSLFTVPGGNYNQMVKEFKPLVPRIQNLVRSDGTGYLGICNGAIAASKKLVTLPKGDLIDDLSIKKMRDHRSEPSGLNLYSKYCCQWPSLGSQSYCTQQVCRPQQKPLNAFFCEGVFFPTEHTDTTIQPLLIYHDRQFNGTYPTSVCDDVYRDDADNPSTIYYQTKAPYAAVTEKAGKGTVVLSGVHPEIDSEVVKLFDVKTSYLQRLAKATTEQLQPYKAEQTDLMRLYLNTLNIATKKV